MILPLPDPHDRWVDDIRRHELDVPLAERADPFMFSPAFGVLRDRTNALAQEMVLMGRHAALQWIDITERELENTPELDHVEILVTHDDRLRFYEYEPREACLKGQPGTLVRLPDIRMFETTEPLTSTTDAYVENTIIDSYIDGFESLAVLWNPLLEHEIGVSMLRIVQECPHGVGRNDLQRARRAVLGDVAVQLEGERLRAVIESAPDIPPPLETAARRRM